MATQTVYIYHITDTANLPSILAAGGLCSDSAMTAAQNKNRNIGYNHIKQRRAAMNVACHTPKVVADFVPFYFCPRTPMLYTINQGNVPGCPAGSQATIVHLVSSVNVAIATGKAWAFTNLSANASYPPKFYDDLARLDQLQWSVIRSDQWSGRSQEKQAEFLVEDFFPFSAISTIGCHSPQIANQVAAMMNTLPNAPRVEHRPTWYY